MKILIANHGEDQVKYQNNGSCTFGIRATVNISSSNIGELGSKEPPGSLEYESRPLQACPTIPFRNLSSPIIKQGFFALTAFLFKGFSFSLRLKNILTSNLIPISNL